MTKLIDAILNLDIENIQSLIKSGVDVNEIDEVGKTALMYISCFKARGKSFQNRVFEKNKVYSEGVVDGKETLIVDSQRMMNTKDDFINTYQMYMLYKEKIFNMLIDAGADINICESTFGASVLMYAGQGESTENLKRLIDLGVNVNKQDNRGATALTGAIKEGKIELLKILLENGADPSIRINEGEYFGGLTALGFAEHIRDSDSVWLEKTNNLEIIELLKEYGEK